MNFWIAAGVIYLSIGGLIACHRPKEAPLSWLSVVFTIFLWLPLVAMSAFVDNSDETRPEG